MPQTPLPTTLFKYLSYVIPAGSIQTLDFVGNYILLLSNTGATNTLTVSFDGQEFQNLITAIVLTNPKNPDGTYVKFARLIFKNNDVNPCTIAFYAGNGEIDYKALVLSGTVTTNLSSTAFTTPASVTVTTTTALLIAGNSARRSITISNNDTNGRVLWVGDANTDAGAGRGIPIQNGEKLTLTTQGAIYADASASTIATSYLEETGT